MKELDQNMSKDNSIPDDTISQSSKASLMADKLRAKVKNLESSYLQQRSKMPTSQNPKRPPQMNTIMPMQTGKRMTAVAGANPRIHHTIYDQKLISQGAQRY